MKAPVALFRSFSVHLLASGLLLLGLIMIGGEVQALRAEDAASKPVTAAQSQRRPSDLENQFNFVALNILFTLALSVPTISMVLRLRRAIQTHKFIPTRGLLTSFEPSYNDDGDFIVHADLIYRYEIPKDELESTVVGVQPTPAQFEILANAWQEGGEVTVYYNPENSGESVLFRGVNPSLILASGATILAWLALVAYASGFLDYLIKMGFLVKGGRDHAF